MVKEPITQDITVYQTIDEPQAMTFTINYRSALPNNSFFTINYDDLQDILSVYLDSSIRLSNVSNN